MLALPLTPTAPSSMPHGSTRNTESASARPTTRTASRILALRLDESSTSPRRQRLASERRRAKLVSSQQASAARGKVAEAFLKFSPRVQLRLTGEASVFWLFLDVASTSHLFGGETSLALAATLLARELGYSVQSAIADTPAGAQVFAITTTLCPPGEEHERLKDLSLPHLLHLEGLESWAKPSAIESIITFFLMLGFKTVGDLSHFTLASFQERWGETGALLWQRMRAQDRGVISPLVPVEPLEDYMHLDFPVSLVSLLLHQINKSTGFLFARLQGRKLLVQKLTLTLHCEYAKTQHKIEIEPNVPSRDHELFATLLENRLSDLELENPIRDFEIHIVPSPEKSQQLDFFAPQNSHQDRLQMLMSLLMQSSIKLGHFAIEPSIVPEKSWRVVNSMGTRANESTSFVSEKSTITKDLTGRGATNLRAIASQPEYGGAISHAPRPTRLLREPQPLSIEELQKMNVLSSTPIERLESAWWNTDPSHVMRDYYFAVSESGQCLWIFQDPRSQEYFLHGYFD